MAVSNPHKDYNATRVFTQPGPKAVGPRRIILRIVLGDKLTLVCIRPSIDS